MAELDLDTIRPWATPCPSCDYGPPGDCTCPEGDYRIPMSALVTEVERLRQDRRRQSAVVSAALERAIRDGREIDGLKRQLAELRAQYAARTDELTAANTRIGALEDALREGRPFAATDCTLSRQIAARAAALAGER